MKKTVYSLMNLILDKSELFESSGVWFGFFY